MMSTHRPSQKEPRYLWCLDCDVLLGPVPRQDSHDCSDAVVKVRRSEHPHMVMVVRRSAVPALAGDLTAAEALDRLHEHRAVGLI